MKISKKFIPSMFTLLIICLLVACSGSNLQTKQVWIDNPTDNPIKVMIDEQNFDIPANSGVYADIAPGKHKLTYDSQSVNFVLIPNDQGVVLNPTLSNYIFYHEMYQEEGKEEKAQQEMERTQNAYSYDYAVNGDTIQVPFKVINPLFIEQYEYFWHFGVNEPYQDNISIAKGGSSSSSFARSKIFRMKEFIEYMGGEEFSTNFNLPVSTDKLADVKPYDLIPDSLTTDCPEANLIIESMRDQFKALTNAKPQEIKTKEFDFQQTFYKIMDSQIANKCNSNPESNYQKTVATIGKNLEKWGAKNAYIVE